MTLADLANTGKDKTGILIGKGPSQRRALYLNTSDLDTFIVVGINQSPANIKCHFNLIHDPVPLMLEFLKDSDKHYLNKSCIPVLPPEFKENGGPQNSLFFNKEGGLYLKRELYLTNNSLFMGHCTAHSAFLLLWLLGVKSVTAYGFDAVIDKEVEESMSFGQKEVYEKAALRDPNWKQHHERHYARFRQMLQGMSYMLQLPINFA